MKTIPLFTMSFTESADVPERKRIVDCLAAQEWPYKIIKTKVHNNAVNLNIENKTVHNGKADAKMCLWTSPCPDNYETRFKVANHRVFIRVHPHEGGFIVEAFIDSRYNSDTTKINTPEEVPDTIRKVLCGIETNFIQEKINIENTQARKLKLIKDYFGEGFIIEEYHNNYEFTIRLEGMDSYGYNVRVSVSLDTDFGDILTIRGFDYFDIKSSPMMDRVKELMRIIALQAKMEEAP